jgi:hypothetical protein
MIENYKFKYRSRGKWFFVPNEKCERRGRRMLGFFKKRVVFPNYMYHFKKGGHVAALHAPEQQALLQDRHSEFLLFNSAHARYSCAPPVALSWCRHIFHVVLRY